MTAWYNEHDRAAANWLRELIHNGHIAPGVVDERSIRDVSADDLRGFTQCHFFAGIGVWSHAFRRAGWSDDRPVGSGSCPCQPFSAAGKGLGFEDPRHLWPDLLRIIRDARHQGQQWPNRFFGEQAPTAGAWVDLVRSDLEALGYAFGSPDLPAAGFGGAHIRQRFYWVADAHNAERWTDLAPRNVGDWPEAGRVEGPGDAQGRGGAGGLADAHGRHPGAEWEQRGGEYGQQQADGGPGRLGDPDCVGEIKVRRISAGAHPERRGGVLGAADWLFCRDDSWRPVESGTFPLAHEDPARLGRLRGYGNALDSETATNFIAAFMDAAEIGAAA